MNKNQNKHRPPSSAPVFKDKEMLTPVSSADTVGYEIFGDVATLVILIEGIWIPAAIAGMQSLNRLFGTV